MVNLQRWLKHCFMPPWYWRRKFPKASLRAIEDAITQSETLHRAELRLAVENALPPSAVWRGMTARQRAAMVFAHLGIWDTEENNGVLIYLQLADREVHILADRGIANYVTLEQWQVIATAMQREFHQGHYQAGALLGIQQISQLLAEHFPPGANKLNELPNQPVIIKNLH